MTIYQYSWKHIGKPVGNTKKKYEMQTRPSELDKASSAAATVAGQSEVQPCVLMWHGRECATYVRKRSTS